MIAIDAILFDLDGTLIDSQKDLAESVRYLQRAYQLPLSDDRQVASFIGDGVVRLVERAVPGLQGDPLQKAVEQFKDYYRQHCLDRTILCDGAREVLEWFQNKKLAVVTNKPERISRRILAGLDVADYFSVVLGGDSLPRKKPDPLPIQQALVAMGGISPTRAVMVGDGVNDIAAGRAAGVLTCDLDSTISHNGSKKTQRPDFKILNLHELMRIFN